MRTTTLTQTANSRNLAAILSSYESRNMTNGTYGTASQIGSNLLSIIIEEATTELYIFNGVGYYFFTNESEL